MEQYIEKYKNLVYTVCYSFTKNPYDAEDLAQETFLAAFKNLSRFDGENPKSWLTTIAANKCRDFLKSPARLITPTQDETLDLSAKGDAEADAERELSDERARTLCRSLREPYATAAYLYYCEDLTMAEIAGRLGEPPKTVATRLYRAKAMLRENAREVLG